MKIAFGMLLNAETEPSKQLYNGYPINQGPNSGTGWNGGIGGGNKWQFEYF